MSEAYRFSFDINDKICEAVDTLADSLAKKYNLTDWYWNSEVVDLLEDMEDDLPESDLAAVEYLKELNDLTLNRSAMLM